MRYFLFLLELLLTFTFMIRFYHSRIILSYHFWMIILKMNICRYENRSFKFSALKCLYEDISNTLISLCSNFWPSFWGRWSEEVLEVYHERKSKLCSNSSSFFLWDNFSHPSFKLLLAHSFFFFVLPLSILSLNWV